MDRRKLRDQLDFFAIEAKTIAKSTVQGNRAFATDEQPRLDQTRTDILAILPTGDRKSTNAKLDRIVACAELIEQHRFEAFQSRRKAEQMRRNAEADLQEAEIERLIVEISGHLGFQ